MRSSWCDDQLADSVARDSEGPLQLGGATGKVARQPARDHEAIGSERIGANDIGRVRVSRRWAYLPGADRGGPVTRFALVDHRCVIGEQGNDRLDLAIGVEHEVAAD